MPTAEKPKPAEKKAAPKKKKSIEKTVDPPKENESTNGKVDDKGVVPKGGAVEEHNKRVKEAAEEREEKTREQEIAEAREALDALDPSIKPVRRIVGKTPDYGGNEKTYSVYMQDKLPWMARQRFFSHVTKTMARAIKATGGDIGGMSDVFGNEDGNLSLRERGRRLTSRDFKDAASFFELAMELVSHSPDFLIQCYIIWLDVPRKDRAWAEERFDETWDPENEKWGLKDEEHEQIIQTFIDQNYEDIRRFFTETLPGLAKRVALHERATDRQNDKDRDSE